MNSLRCLSCMTPLSGASACPACGTQVGSEPDNPLYLPAGCLLNNRYLIGKVIGVGGFGIVYLAWDNNLDIKVAIKEYLPKEYAARASDHLSLTPYTGNAKDEYGFGMEKFLDEAKALAKFQDHAGIVTVYESFKANNTAYMVMQYLDGITLKDFLKRQPGERIAVDIAVKILTPIMDALREVHNAGFVHRDISPDNIFITRQKQIKLLDFGAARYAIGEHSKSLTTVLKHGYAPPEQYSSKGNQGPWTDVYAVAATLYRCITGEPPPDAMERLQGDSIKSPKQLEIDISLQVELALMKGMALKASSRFDNMAVFSAAVSAGIFQQNSNMEQCYPTANQPTAPNALNTKTINNYNNSAGTFSKISNFISSFDKRIVGGVATLIGLLIPVTMFVYYTKKPDIKKAPHIIEKRVPIQQSMPKNNTADTPTEVASKVILSKQQYKDKADILLEKEFYEDLLKLAKEWANNYPEDVDPIYFQAIYNYFNKNYAGSISLLNKCMELDPNNINYYYYYALNFVSLNDLNNAVSILEKAQQKNIAGSNFLILLAYAKIYRQYDLNKSIYYYQQAVKIKENSVATTELAKIYFDNADYVKSKQMLLKVAHYNPENPTIIGNLGIVSVHAGDRNTALRCYTKLSTIDPVKAQELAQFIAKRF